MDERIAALQPKILAKERALRQAIEAMLSDASVEHPGMLRTRALVFDAGEHKFTLRFTSYDPANGTVAAVATGVGEYQAVQLWGQLEKTRLILRAVGQGVTWDLGLKNEQRLEGGYSSKDGLSQVSVTVDVSATLIPILYNTNNSFNYITASDVAKLQIESLKSALDLYRLDTGSYPSPQQGLGVLLKDPGNVRGWKGPYFGAPSVPADPWGNPYNYRAPGEHGPFDIYSLGSDRAQGGTGEAADVTSWGS